MVQSDCSYQKGETMNEQQQTLDRKEIECERCGYWPCVCGDPDFESAITAELRKAEEAA